MFLDEKNIQIEKQNHRAFEHNLKFYFGDPVFDIEMNSIYKMLLNVVSKQFVTVFIDCPTIRPYFVYILEFDWPVFVLVFG